MIRRIAFVVVFLAFVPCQADENSVYAEFPSVAFGKNYVTIVTDKALDASPVWRDDAESPPVSARKAIKLGDALRAKLVKDTKDYKWRRESAEILFVAESDRCFWRVHYEAHVTTGGESGLGHYLDIVILMDGRVLNPVVSDLR
jgi:hypothetical protein